MVEAGTSCSIRGEAGGALIAMRSFEFVFILYLMYKIMGITNLLCQALQYKSLNILNAMDLVSTTKALFKTFRVTGFDILLKYVESICTQYDIDLPLMCACYKDATGRSCQQKDHITVEHHYRFDKFNTIIDLQLTKINNRFNEGAMELLILNSALEPKDGFKSLEIDKIYNLADKFYPADFTKQEMHYLRCQLKHYELDAPHHQEFQNMSTISKLCRSLVETNKSQHYYLIDRLIRLVLTLLVTTTIERAFSAMKHVKAALRNKMEDEFLADSMIVYNERELSELIDSGSIIDDFSSMKNRQAQLQ